MNAGMAALAAGLCCAGAAMAAPKTSVSYKTYAVSGETAAAIYASIQDSGPNLNGMNAFAITRPRYRLVGRPVMKAGQCRAAGVGLEIAYDVTLPVHMDENALEPGLKGAWGVFSGHVKAHEGEHVRIWNECAQKADRALQALRSASCNGLGAKAAALLRDMQKTCSGRHEAFDRAEARNLSDFAFMRMVLKDSLPPEPNGPGTVTRALRAPEP